MVAAKPAREPLTRSASATAASFADTIRSEYSVSRSSHVCPAFMLILVAGMPSVTALTGTLASGGSCSTAMSAVSSLMTLAARSGTRSFDASTTAPVSASTTIQALGGGGGGGADWARATPGTADSASATSSVERNAAVRRRTRTG